MNLSRGQRAKLADLVPNAQAFTLGIAVNAPGLRLDFACFGLDGQSQLSDERYMTFFNQPATPCGGVALSTPPGDAAGFDIQLRKLPASIEKLTITAAIEGTGTMSAIINGHARLLDGTRETARFAFTGADFAQERALILLEIYRKDGIWRVCALGQGFEGGLAALVGHFGGTVAEEAPPKPPPLSLEKRVERQAPSLVSLAKKAGVSLEQKKLGQVVARVALVLDASGSMSAQYRQGRVQEIVERILPLAVHFDDDGALDCWIFADRCKRLPAATLENFQGYVAREAPWTSKSIMSSPIGGVNNEPGVMREVMAWYREGTTPAYVLFISDGGVHRNKEIETLMRDAAKWPIFWQFVGLGGRNYGILEKLDSLSGRVVDNCGFFALDDLHDISESALYDRLLNEFPSWLDAARRQGILH